MNSNVILEMAVHYPGNRVEKGAGSAIAVHHIDGNANLIVDLGQIGIGIFIIVG